MEAWRVSAPQSRRNDAGRTDVRGWQSADTGQVPVPCPPARPLPRLRLSLSGLFSLLLCVPCIRPPLLHSALLGRNRQLIPNDKSYF